MPEATRGVSIFHREPRGVALDVLFVAVFAVGVVCCLLFEVPRALGMQLDGELFRWNRSYVLLTGDLFFDENHAFARVNAGITGLVFLPFYLLLIYAFIRGANWIRLPALLYVGAMVYRTIEYLLWEFSFVGPMPTRVGYFILIHSAFLFVPIMLGARMRKAQPFGPSAQLTETTSTELEGETEVEPLAHAAPLALPRARAAAWLLDLVVLVIVFLRSPSTPMWAFLLLLVAYHTVFTYLTRQTLGKAVVGLETIRTNRAPTVWWALGRSSLGYYVVSVLGLGGLWAFVDRSRRMPHDYAFRSVVVLARHGNFFDRLSALAERRAKALAKASPFWAPVVALLGAVQGISNRISQVVNWIARPEAAIGPAAPTAA